MKRQELYQNLEIAEKKGSLWKNYHINSNGSDTWQGGTSVGGNWDDKLNLDFYIFTDHGCLVPKF